MHCDKKTARTQGKGTLMNYKQIHHADPGSSRFLGAVPITQASERSAGHAKRIVPAGGA